MILLAAAIIAVPLSRFLGIGAVLGYLIAGMALGPSALGLVNDAESLLHKAEFGVVLLLFIIGLELEPQRFWTMRKLVFGVGAVQVFVTGFVLAGIVWLFGQSFSAALLIGLALALSSTALALQILSERQQLSSRHGRTAFAILLFQDLAAVPLLVAVPLLAADTGNMGAVEVLVGVVRAIVVIAAVAFACRYLLRFGLRMVAKAEVNEVFTAVALFVVIGSALAMELAGLSMALGAFVAGVLLADSEYKNQLEAHIEPFKGLLLGLFFMAVGMSIDVSLIVSEPLTVAGIVIGLLALKMAILFGISHFVGQKPMESLGLALILPQGGEFAFVIFGAAARADLMEPVLSDLLIASVGLSMAVTPLFYAIYLGFARRRSAKLPEVEVETLVAGENPIIIAGFGRVGQIIGRLLAAKHIGFTALEKNPDQVDFVKKFGNKVYYGDATRLELLRAAKVGQAKMFVIALNNVEASLKVARLLARHYPDLPVIARVRNREHAWKMMELGITRVFRDTFPSSLEMAHEMLVMLGYHPSRARQIVALFRQHDEERLKAQAAKFGDDAAIIEMAKRGSEELERLFAEDALEAERDEVETEGGRKIRA